MAIKQLTEEQVRDWTVEQKDKWWLENVYRGDVPQLTVRSVLTGALLGGVLSLTNLYVGAKTGWSLGVGITAVVLAFAAFKVMSKMGVARDYTVLENNITQSIAVAAGYMTAPMISSLAAYMMYTGVEIPLITIFFWVTTLAVLGVLFAFPLKRRFINDEQHAFPEGRAAGIVMDALHTGDVKSGMFKAKLLAGTGAAAALFTLMKSGALMSTLKVGFLTIPHTVDNWIYKFWTPGIAGTPLKELTIRPDTDVVMMAAGGLMGIRTGVSLMIGAIVNYAIMSPLAIQNGDVVGAVGADGVLHFGFKDITMWALWCGVAMMTTASLFAFFSKPKMLLRAFSGMFSKRSGEKEDVVRDIELPLKVFVIGIPVVGAVVVFLANHYFDVEVWLGAIAVPMVFVFTLIAAHSTALTSITPTGALGKLTQLTFGALAPGNVKTNLMTAGITGEVAGHASNLLMNIKPGYMLGAKPRLQAIGHVIGIFAGAFAAVPVFQLLFMQNGPEGLITEEFPMPAATIWKAVAEVLTSGLSNLQVSAQWAALVGALIGILFEVIKMATRGRFWLSGVGIGLAFVIPFNTCLAMFTRAFFFWVCGKIFTDEESSGHRVVVPSRASCCSRASLRAALHAVAELGRSYLRPRSMPMVRSLADTVFWSRSARSALSCFSHHSRATSSLQEPTSRHPRSASRNAIALCGRIARSFSRHSMMSASRSGGTGLPSRSEGATGGAWRWAPQTSTTLAPSNTCSPVIKK